MKIPAIRAKIGTWIYYISSLSFEQVNNYVKPINDELHKSQLLRDMLQRSITDNYRSIANYIMTQEDRFFNALILAVYDGDPQWHEVRIDDDGEDEYLGLGVLELSGEEKIFPIDGQHRAEGIKRVLSECTDFNSEQIPVVFIGHRKDDDGMQRARRLFSTLNRYAKPVSMRDIIALDEDDIIAIVSRELIDCHMLFSKNRILDSKTKAIPESNTQSFTTIITFYECNRILLSLYLRDKVIRNADGKKLKGKSKIDSYIRFRPSNQEIEDFYKICLEFWDGLSKVFCDLKDYSNMDFPETKDYRNKNGGNLLFRPAALIPFTKATIQVVLNQNCSFVEAFSRFPVELLKIDQPIWRNVIWNSKRRTMIMNNQKLTEKIFLFYWDCDSLSDKEILSIKEDLKVLNQIDDSNDIEDLMGSVGEKGEE